MAVDDLWYLATPDPETGERIRAKRHGRGKRWRVRNVGAPSRLFERKTDAALRHDANARADLNRGQYIDPRDGQMLVRVYAEQWRKDKLHRATTAEYVENSLRLHILPIIGHMQLAQVRPSHIRAWVKDRSDVLAPSTMRVTFTHLSGLFAAAVDDRRIASTPCIRIQLPDIPDTERFIPSPEQAACTRQRRTAALPSRRVPRRRLRPAARRDLRP